MRNYPKRLTAAAAVLLFGALGSTQAQACSCIDPVLAYESTDTVVVARVLRKEKCNPRKHGADLPKSDKGFFGRMTGNMFKSYTCHRVEVMQTLRGETPSKFAVIGKTNPSSAACETSFEIGEHVLLLENGVPPYWANLCSALSVQRDSPLLKRLEETHGVTFNVEGLYSTESAEAPADEGN